MLIPLPPSPTLHLFLSFPIFYFFLMPSPPHFPSLIFFPPPLHPLYLSPSPHTLLLPPLVLLFSYSPTLPSPVLLLSFSFFSPSVSRLLSSCSYYRIGNSPDRWLACLRFTAMTTRPQFPGQNCGRFASSSENRRENRK